MEIIVVVYEVSYALVTSTQNRNAVSMTGHQQGTDHGVSKEEKSADQQIVIKETCRGSMRTSTHRRKSIEKTQEVKLESQGLVTKSSRTSRRHIDFFLHCSMVNPPDLLNLLRRATFQRHLFIFLFTSRVSILCVS